MRAGSAALQAQAAPLGGIVRQGLILGSLGDKLRDRDRLVFVVDGHEGHEGLYAQPGLGLERVLAVNDDADLEARTEGAGDARFQAHDLTDLDRALKIELIDARGHSDDAGVPLRADGRAAPGS